MNTIFERKIEDIFLPVRLRYVLVLKRTVSLRRFVLLPTTYNTKINYMLRTLN